MPRPNASALRLTTPLLLHLTTPLPLQVNIYKEPVTDLGKILKKGRMTLELDESDHYVTRTEGTGDPPPW